MSKLLIIDSGHNEYVKGKDEIGLMTRCNKANDYWENHKKPNCLFLSIHANAYKEWSIDLFIIA